MDKEAVLEWYRRKRTPKLAAGQVMELYFQFHPRTSFLKTLPSDASVVDIGAGDGSLSIFRNWPAPKRRDLRMYAYSIEKGERFDDFEAYEISDWNKAPPDFGGATFDAIVSAHFIEHIDDPATLITWAERKLKRGGRAYIEWPSAESLTLPGKQTLSPSGVDLMVTRFDDDPTHQALPERETIVALATAAD